MKSKVKIDVCIEVGIRIIICVILVMFIRSILKVNLEGFGMLCDTDMYLDTLVAKLMWEGKTLFPNNWIFGNQYYVVATPVLCSLLYGMSGDLNMAMGIASCIMACLVLLSFVWMVWPFVRRKTNILIGMVALLGCVIGEKPYYSLLGQLFFVMCSYYACYLAVAFYTWGIYVRIRTEKEKFSNKSKILLVIALMLSFCTGMQSIRQMIVMVLPMCCFELLLLFFCGIKKKYVTRQTLIFVGTVFLANVGGILFVKMLKIPQSVIYGDIGLIGSMAELQSNTIECVEVVANFFGNIMSDEIWVKVLSILSIIAVVISVISMLRNIEKKSGFFDLFFLCFMSFAIVLIGKMFTHMVLRETYLFMWFPLVCISLVYLFEKCSAKRYVIYVILFCVCAYQSHSISYSKLEEDLEWKAVRWTECLAIAEWMENNNFDVIYGGWDVSSKIAMASNGSVVTACWANDSEWSMFVIDRCLVNVDLLNEEGNENALYMITSGNENIFVDKAKNAGAQVRLVRESDVLECKIYTSDKYLIEVEE